MGKEIIAILGILWEYGLKSSDLGYVTIADKMGLGKMDISKLNIKKINI